jgi:deazaflavin-dependent oxidoreductase (nitroreductase family)
MPQRKYIQPGKFTRGMNNLLARFGGTAVAIPGRKSGVMRLTSVIPVTVEGKQYLVSTRGDSDWVLNLKAAGTGELRKGRKSQPFTAIEISGEERDQVIEAYRKKVGMEVNQYFNELPDPNDHPTFRLKFLA